MAFQKGNKLGGRPKGSKNKRSQLPDTLTKSALEQLEIAVDAGESYAITLVLDRVMPKLKPITPEDSLDGEMLKAKIAEFNELNERITALEIADKSNAVLDAIKRKHGED